MWTGSTPHNNRNTEAQKELQQQLTHADLSGWKRQGSFVNVIVADFLTVEKLRGRVRCVRQAKAQRALPQTCNCLAKITQKKLAKNIERERKRERTGLHGEASFFQPAGRLCIAGQVRSLTNLILIAEENGLGDVVKMMQLVFCAKAVVFH